MQPVGYTKEAILYGMGNHSDFIWIDADTAGKMLHPESNDPADAVQKIFNRHREDFKERDTVLLDVDFSHYLQGQSVPAATTIEIIQKRQVRFFSVPYGFTRLGYFSRSKFKAKIVDWVLDTREAFLRGTLPKPEPSLLRLAYMPLHSRELIEERKRIAEADGVTVHTIRRREARIRAGEPVNKPRPTGEKASHHKHRAKFKEAINLRKQGLTGIEISRKLDVPDKTLYRWFKKV